MKLIVTASFQPLDAARRAARALLNAGCVKVRTDEPFRLPSGWASPVYMDCRRFISFPLIRRELVSLSLGLLKECGCLNGVVSVVGGESSGIALAAWLCDALELPLQCVRKKPIGQTQIEGVFAPRDHVLLVDDLMAGGHSKVKFCRALTAASMVVTDVFVLFDYGTFPTAALLAPFGVKVHSLATWQDVLAAAREMGVFEARGLAEIEEFLADPSHWSQTHGGIAISQPVR